MFYGSALREFLFDDALWAACCFWEGRFVLTLTSKKANWSLNTEIYQIFNEVFEMAKKPIKEGQSYAKSDASSIRWVNVSLSDDDVQALTDWLVNDPPIFVEFCRLVDAGYAYGCKPAADGNGFMATLIGRNPSIGSETCGLSAYAANAYDASGALLFKFVAKLDSIFPEGSAQTRARFR